VAFPYSYEGDFFSGDFHGQGKYTLANGDTYVGQWSEDKKHGARMLALSFLPR